MITQVNFVEVESAFLHKFIEVLLGFSFRCFSPPMDTTGTIGLPTSIWSVVFQWLVELFITMSRISSLIKLRGIRSMDWVFQRLQSRTISALIMSVVIEEDLHQSMGRVLK